MAALCQAHAVACDVFALLRLSLFIGLIALLAFRIEAVDKRCDWRGPKALQDL